MSDPKLLSEASDGGVVSPPIHALRIGQFRTLRGVQLVADGRLTVVCGPNNSGKSSLLDAVQFWGEALGRRSSGKQADGQGGGFSIGIDIRSEAILSLFGEPNRKGKPTPAAEWLAENLGLSEGELWWVPVDPARRTTTQEFLKATTKQLPSDNALNTREHRFGRTVYRVGGGNGYRLTEDWFKAVIAAVLPDRLTVRRIGDIRRGAERALTEEQLTVLARDAGPTTHEPPRKRAQWARTLEELLQRVFGSSARYQARAEENGNQVVMALDGDIDMPLDQVGAGVREVVAVGYAALAEGGADVVCIEEPENCLHPHAARRLIKALVDLTDAQLIVTTHSAAIINSEPDTVIELRRSSDGTTSSRRVANAAERFETIRHLGHDPSDLVLTNCVVWVEGPSDRIYLTTWLRECHGLTEGIDYTVAFSGGALGARIGIEQDPDGRRFAEIRELCRRCVMLADSDRSKPDATLKPHVRRWQESVTDDDDALVIVTDGREIENSAPLAAINSARQRFDVREVRPDDHRFGRAVPGQPKKVDKVRFAEHVTANGGDKPAEQARQWLDEIAEFIRASRNGV